MLSETHLTRLSAAARGLAHVKQALGPNPYVLDAWSPAARLNLQAFRPTAPQSLGEAASRSMSGMNRLVGHTGRMLFTGHGGKPSILGNLWENATSGASDMAGWLAGGAKGPKPWLADSSTPMGRTWDNLANPGRMFSDPWRRAQSEIGTHGRAMGEAGTLGGYVSQPFIDTYQRFKGIFSGPRRPNT